jgi:hypothetical protein
MIKNLPCALIIILFCIPGKAQQLQAITSAGNYAFNSTGSISWTLGEPVIKACNTSESVLTQGFQQIFISISSVGQAKNALFSISAWPNPTSDNVILAVDNTEKLIYQLFDINGKLIRSGKIESASTSVDVSLLGPSIYFIIILKDNIEVKTFKLIKQ